MSEKGDVAAAGPKDWKRGGITSEEAQKLIEIHGFNELEVQTVSLYWLFFLQFTGLMPYMLEIAMILAIAVLDYIDFIIIFVIIMCNGILGFTEELKAKNSLDELTNTMEQKIAVLRDGAAVQVSSTISFSKVPYKSNVPPSKFRHSC